MVRYFEPFRVYILIGLLLEPLLQPLMYAPHIRFLPFFQIRFSFLLRIVSPKMFVLKPLCITIYTSHRHYSPYTALVLSITLPPLYSIVASLFHLRTPILLRSSSLVFLDFPLGLSFPVVLEKQFLTLSSNIYCK